MRPWILALAVGLACRPGRSHPNQAQEPTPGPGASPDSALATRWPLLDVFEVHLAKFDTQFTRAEQDLRSRASTPAGDSLFLRFRDAYTALAESLTEQLGDDRTGEAPSSSQDPTADSLRAVLHRHGYALNFSEGNAFVDEDIDHLLSVFGPLVTRAMREYLSIRNAEYQVRFSEDAALDISWDSLGDRIATWERFLQTYPTFTGHDGAEDWRDMYLETYLTGMDNTRTFSDSGVLEPAVRKSYERFLRDHSDTPAAQVIRDYLALLATNPSPADSTLERFLREHKLRSMLGVQPPVN